MFNKKHFWLVALAFSAMILDPSLGYAAGVMDNVTQRFHSASSGWSSAFLSAGERLFWILVPIGMVWRFGLQAVRGGGATEILAEFVRFTVFIGFYFWLCLHGVSMGESIITSMKQLAGQASGQSGLNPSDIMDVGFSTLSVVTTAFQSLSWKQVPEGIVMLLSGLVFVLICALVAVNMLLALVSAWILMYAGVFILGFGGAAWTSEMAIGYFRSVFSAGLRIAGMILVVGVSSSVLHSYASNVKLASIGDCAVLLVVALVMYMLSEKIPDQLAALPSGSTGSNAAVSGAGAMGASMAAGAMLAQGMKLAASTMTGGAAGIAGAASAVKAAISEAQNDLAQGTAEGASSGGAADAAIGGLSEAMGGGENSTPADAEDFEGDSVAGGSEGDEDNSSGNSDDAENGSETSSATGESAGESAGDANAGAVTAGEDASSGETATVNDAESGVGAVAGGLAAAAQQAGSHAGAASSGVESSAGSDGAGSDSAGSAGGVTPENGSDNNSEAGSTSGPKPGKMAIAKGAAGHLAKAAKSMAQERISNRVGQTLGGRMASRISENAVSGRAETAHNAAVASATESGASPEAAEAAGRAASSVMKNGGTFAQASQAATDALSQISAGAEPSSIAPESGAGGAGESGAGGDTGGASVPWMHQTGGYDALSDADKQVAQNNHAAWQEETGNSFDLHSYVKYAQNKHAERNAPELTPEDHEEIDRLSGSGAA